MPMRKTSSFQKMVGLAKDARWSTFNTVKKTASFKKKKSKERTGPSTDATEFSMLEFDLFLKDSELRREISQGCLHQLEQSLELDSFVDVLHGVEVGLLSILKSYPTLDSKIVSEIHTHLGLVYLELENNSAAVDAFTRAIWFRRRNTQGQFKIAKANHRLGLAYGRKKDYKQAIVLLTRAVESYESYDTSSELYALAKADRHEFQEEEQLKILRKLRPEAIRRPLGRSTSYDALENASLKSSRGRSPSTGTKNRNFSNSTSSMPNGGVPLTVVLTPRRGSEHSERSSSSTGSLLRRFSGK